MDARGSAIGPDRSALGVLADVPFVAAAGTTGSSSALPADSSMYSTSAVLSLSRITKMPPPKPLEATALDESTADAADVVDCLLPAAFAGVAFRSADFDTIGRTGSKRAPVGKEMYASCAGTTRDRFANCSVAGSSLRFLDLLVSADASLLVEVAAGGSVCIASASASTALLSDAGAACLSSFTRKVSAFGRTDDPNQTDGIHRV